MFRALTFKVDHVTWPRPFQRQFVVSRLGLAMISRHIKFEVYAITCNKDMKGNSKLCNNSRFEPPFGGIKDNTQGSSVARWKAHCRLSISDNSTFLVGSHGCCTIKRNLSKSAFPEGVGHFERKFLGTWRRRPQSVYRRLDWRMM